MNSYFFARRVYLLLLLWLPIPLCSMVSVHGCGHINSLPDYLKGALIHRSIEYVGAGHRDPLVPFRQLAIFSQLSKSWHALSVPLISHYREAYSTYMDRIKLKFDDRYNQLFLDTDNPIALLYNIWVGRGGEERHLLVRVALARIRKAE